MTAIIAVLAGVAIILGNAPGTRARIAVHVVALILGVLVVVVGVLGLVLFASGSYGVV
jgi:hypothetical protein